MIMCNIVLDELLVRATVKKVICGIMQHDVTRMLKVGKINIFEFVNLWKFMMHAGNICDTTQTKVKRKRWSTYFN